MDAALLLAAALACGQIAQDDYSAGALLTETRAIERSRARGGYDMPLAQKAMFLEWHLWRYCATPEGQVYRATLPETPGTPPQWLPGADSSTWNGALLAALCYKFAVTRDPETLERLAQLVRGLHLFFAITQKPGLPARTMTKSFSLAPADFPTGEGPLADWRYRADPAKGTVNQLAAGYAALFMLVGESLPADVHAMARADAAAMALHLVDHDYRLTEKDGRETTYGNLTPLAGTIGVPFNAQVAYQIISLGHHFPPPDAAAAERIAGQFHRLRHKHHVYYEHPLKSAVQPQRVAASPFVKGMNDRNHVTSAAFVGLLLEGHEASRAGRAVDEKFVYQLGQTICFSMERLAGEHNALCNLMWAALASRKEFAPVFPDPRAARPVLEQALVDAVEQLRRYPIDRFSYPGEPVEQRKPVWVNEWCVDDFCWKVDPRVLWKKTGPATTTTTPAIDFLYAYWLMRYYRLDENSVARQRHARVLVRGDDSP